jgi:hypothetical protein
MKIGDSDGGALFERNGLADRFQKSLSSSGDMRNLGKMLGVADSFQRDRDKAALAEATDGANASPSTPEAMKAQGYKKGGRVRGCGIASRGKTRGKIV